MIYKYDELNTTLFIAFFLLQFYDSETEELETHTHFNLNELRL